MDIKTGDESTKSMKNIEIDKTKLIYLIRKNLFSRQYVAIKQIRSNAPYACFILALCFLDNLSSFYGGQTISNDSSNKKRFGEFLKKYLPQYDNSKDVFYKNFRCGLIHSFSDGEKYYLTRDNKNNHLKIIDGKTVINLENFLGDIEKAFKKYISDINNDARIFDQALKRYRSFGLLEFDFNLKVLSTNKK